MSRFRPDGWDFIALVRINVENGSRELFVVPRDRAIELSRPLLGDKRRLLYRTPELEAYQNNFVLADKVRERS